MLAKDDLKVANEMLAAWVGESVSGSVSRGAASCEGGSAARETDGKLAWKERCIIVIIKCL